MPAAKTAARKGSSKTTRRRAQSSNGTPSIEQAVAALRELDTGDKNSRDLAAAEQQRQLIQEAAAKARAECKYEGRLTWQLLGLLRPLLELPIPGVYIEETPQRSGGGDAGLPFPATGIRSVQVQVDRMNDVLGLTHWDYLTRYPNNVGNLCHAVIVIGNDLAGLRLDDTGQLVPPDEAPWGGEVLLRREGWGGYGRGKLGDAFKGAETNALKRVLARVGPGGEVYRFEFDDDPTAPEVPQPPVMGATPPPAGGPREGEADLGPEPDWRAELDELLGKKDASAELRVEVAKGMELLGAPARQQVQELRAASTKGRLTELQQRINVALDAQGAGDVSG